MMKPSAMFVLVVLGFVSCHVMRGSATGGGGGGEREPEVVIQNRYRGCQPRVECPPYEDDVLFRYKENYSFTWDTNPQKKQITCTAQCTANASQHKSVVSFVGAYRGSNVHKFQWRINEDGVYLTTMDVNDDTIQPYKRMWKW